MNIFVDENIEERYVEGLYEDFIFEEYEKIIFDYLANNCKEFDDEHIQHLVDLKVKQFFKLRKQIDQLTNNWNELEEWLKEYMRKNENWYTNELSTYDKQYYGDTYYTTNAVLMTILDKMKEIKDGNNERTIN